MCQQRVFKRIRSNRMDKEEAKVELRRRKRRGSDRDRGLSLETCKILRYVKDDIRRRIVDLCICLVSNSLHHNWRPFNQLTIFFPFALAQVSSYAFLRQ